ncbi:MAG: CapA family protein [Chloroflexota bacterium]
MKRTAAVVLAGVVLSIAGAAAFGSGVFDGPRIPGSSPPISGVAPGTPSPQPTPAPTPTPTPTPRPTPTPIPLLRVAVAPVTQFRSPYAATTADEVAAVLAGTSTRYAALELVESDAAAILEVLGLTAPAPAADPRAATLILAPGAASLTADLAAHRDRLAFLRATDIGPSVRALAWGEVALFGVDRVRTAADWPLVAAFDPILDGRGMPDLPANPTFDPSGLWTMVAGGDILLDRGVARTVKVDGKGVDFPFDGGTAEITSRYCCSSFGWELPRLKRTGDAGAMRAYLRAADLAIANFENPAPVKFRFHTSGTVFSADPALIEGLANAGIDYVSLANNHIRDAGAGGILETIRHLDAWKIAHGGAGKDLAAARAPAMLQANGTTVAILGRDAIAGGSAATATRVGSAPLQTAAITADIAAARAAGADVVIVFPHWGTEYDPTPFASQKKLARAIIDAGADMVIGNHAHWAAALEVYQGRPIWYALGNFVFDQTWSEPTMEGITLELTFDGATLIQARMRPHIILDKAQPNFMDPAGSGKVVMNQVFVASKGLLPW